MFKSKLLFLTILVINPASLKSTELRKDLKSAEPTMLPILSFSPSIEESTKQQSEKVEALKPATEMQNFLFELFEKENQDLPQELKLRLKDWIEKYDKKFNIVESTTLRKLFEVGTTKKPALIWQEGISKNYYWLLRTAIDEHFDIRNWWQKIFEIRGFYQKLISQKYILKQIYETVLSDCWFKSSEEEKKENEEGDHLFALYEKI